VREFVVDAFGPGTTDSTFEPVPGIHCWAWLYDGRAVVNDTELNRAGDTALFLDGVHRLEVFTGLVIIIYTTRFVANAHSRRHYLAPTRPQTTAKM
jgi:hypothetical protein